MDIKIDGNPGTGNIFQEMIFNNAQNVNTSTTSVVNYNIGAADEPSNDETNEKSLNERESKEKKRVGDLAENPQIRKEILKYLENVLPLVRPERKDIFIKMWEGILEIDAVKEAIYKTGKQKRTNFNRTLIARILHHLDARQMYAKPFKASDFARALEGKYESSVRGELGKFPTDQMCYEIDRCLESLGLYKME